MPDLRRLVVPVVALLLLTGTVLPATAFGSETTADPRSTDLPATDPAPVATAVDAVGVANQTAPTGTYAEANATPAEPTPIERKRAAIALVESMDADRRFQARQRERAIALLNGTLSTYRDDARVATPTGFLHDRRALGAVAALAWTNVTAAEEAAALVVAADLQTVNTSIGDARRALDLAGGRVEEPRQRRRAERSIDRAVRARDRAVDVLEDDGWSRWDVRDRRRALLHLGVAWLHAQYAIEVLDAATAPSVSIDTRSDPPWNASGTATRTVRGTVSDVRAHQLEAVSVSVDGTVVGNATVEAPTVPGANATFAANVTLHPRASTVAVTATDVGGLLDRWRSDGPRDRRRWFTRAAQRISDGRDRLPSRWSGSDDYGEARTDTAVVRFDGDGLPDTFERDVVGTHPLAADSDADPTTADESDDGVLDGGEDFDDDRLVTYAEFEMGTDPFANDSDGDGLPDRFEASTPTLLDPADPDTDGDGVVDGVEDFDGDGLPSADEHRNETSIARPDSDRDGLDDPDELRTHGTSPVDPDSDDDGLGDAEELRLGIDPTTADTDGDGVADGNASYTTTAANPATGVSVSVTGEGDVASRVTVENVTQPPGSDFLAGPVVRIRNETAFEAATVTIPIAEDASADDPANLSVFKWSPEDDRPWHALNSTVDVGNGTASANVTSFSYFSVMDGPAWESAITETVPLTWPRFEGFDDLDGWYVAGDAGLEGGHVVVGGADGSHGLPAIVVAEDGSGDYERIQPAVDAAAPGQTVLVREGTYAGPVVLNESIRLVGEGTVLEGPGTDGESAGVTIRGGRLVTIQDFEISGFSAGILDVSAATDVVVRRTAIRGGAHGIDGRDTAGDWTISNVSLIGNDVGIRAGRAVGDWTLRHVRATESRWFGIMAHWTEGDWTLSRIDASSNGRIGIANYNYEAFLVSESILASNGESGIVSAAAGPIEVRRSRIEGNGREGVNGIDASVTIVATDNWWGEPSGPSPDQVEGNVVATPHCTTEDCAPDEIDVVEPGDGPAWDAGGGGSSSGSSGDDPSTIHRTATLPAGVSSIEATARLKGTGPATFRVSDGRDSLTVADLSSSMESFTSVSADLTGFAGETVTVEVVAEDGAEVVLDWIDVGIDTDGDGLRDEVETADLGIPSGPRPGASLATLDPSNPDSDGDGLQDGAELSAVALRQRSSPEQGFGSLRALRANSDPTLANSDGGGLSDGEEVEAGSDPFVLETLVMGYTIPTMTHGPGDTLADRQPMTVGEAGGYYAGGGSDSALIAWPSRQYDHKWLCISWFTPGPGCSEEWMRGVELEDDKFYIHIPFVVFAQSDTDIGEVPYQLSFGTQSDAKLVKEVNTTGQVEAGRSRSGYVVYGLSEREADNELYTRIFRSIGEVKLDADLSNTVFHRPDPSTIGHRYAVSTSTTLPHTEQMLRDTQFVLEQGINVAFAAEAGYAVAIKTGSSVHGALAFLYHLAKSQTSTPPTSVEDVAEKVGQRGIAAFEEKVRETQGDIEKEVFGDGVVRSVGPSVIRQN